MSTHQPDERPDERPDGKPDRTPIYVTAPSLAPLAEYQPYLQRIWQSGVMTHNGPLVQEFEAQLSQYLGGSHVVCVNSGTSALQLAVRALDLSGDIITTPFTFIATASSILWEYCRPVFVDIDPDTWNIDPQCVASAVTDATCAILAVHVFSAPCALEALQDIADRHQLALIYDAAHAMAVSVRGAAITHHGDISTLSFHATKLLNTGEGGACVTDNLALAERLRRLRFFGFDTQKDVVEIGTNAKMTEINAGLGLANLQRLDQFRAVRRAKYELYLRLLKPVPHVTFQTFAPESYNYSYMPVLFDTEARLLATVQRLAAEQVFPRRYFHPSLHEVAALGAPSSLPVAERISRQILCLPLFDNLPSSDIRRICTVVAAPS